MRAIELADLGRAYGERVALAGVSLELEQGRTLAVFGANGAGKTTLLRILATLLRPHHGTARVLGRELPREGVGAKGKGVPIVMINSLWPRRRHGAAEVGPGRSPRLRRRGG